MRPSSRSTGSKPSPTCSGRARSGGATLKQYRSAKASSISVSASGPMYVCAPVLSSTNPCRLNAAALRAALNGSVVELVTRFRTVWLAMRPPLRRTGARIAGAASSRCSASAPRRWRGATSAPGAAARAPACDRDACGQVTATTCTSSRWIGKETRPMSQYGAGRRRGERNLARPESHAQHAEPQRIHRLRCRAAGSLRGRRRETEASLLVGHTARHGLAGRVEHDDGGIRQRKLARAVAHRPCHLRAQRQRRQHHRHERQDSEVC